MGRSWTAGLGGKLPFANAASNACAVTQKAYARGMTQEVIAHMRARIARTRRAMELAYNKEIIELLEAMIEEAEADIRELEEAIRSSK